MPITAIILAAGEGTRMKSSHPKVLHNLLDKPLLWWAIRSVREAGAERIICVVGHGSDEVRAYFADEEAAGALEFVEQTERLGTGHAVRAVRDAIGGFQGPTVVLSGDTPLVRPETISSLIDHTRSEHFACSVLTFTPPDVAGYGRIKKLANGEIDAIVEDKDATEEERATLTECNSGVYCFCGGRLSANIDRLTSDNAQGEYYLTDMVGIYRELGEPVSSVFVDDYTELLGVNSRTQLAEATRQAQARINASLMAEGVTMLDPALVWVGPEVEVGRDTEVLPLTMLYGATRIGEGCVVGPNTRLTDCTVGNNCTVDETVGIEATLEDRVTTGPRAYLRPGTHLMEGAKAGTHVEIKKSTIGAGSKVPHLSYIGDTEMGEGVNIGAGTITCNYDGKHKSKTVIGDRVFIGSDTMLVAPVTIGDDATTAAASAIAKDVPAGALAIERSEQAHIENYAQLREARWAKEDEEANGNKD